jgi:hypothetical protein
VCEALCLKLIIKKFVSSSEGKQAEEVIFGGTLNIMKEAAPQQDFLKFYIKLLNSSIIALTISGKVMYLHTNSFRYFKML